MPRIPVAKKTELCVKFVWLYFLHLVQEISESLICEWKKILGGGGPMRKADMKYMV